MRKLGYEQAMRMGETFVVAELLRDFAGLLYAHASGQQMDVTEVAHQGWTLLWQLEPTPRIQVRTVGPSSSAWCATCCGCSATS